MTLPQSNLPNIVYNEATIPDTFTLRAQSSGLRL